MQKESIPFGGVMGMEVAFCNGLALDLSEVRRMIWVSGQIAFDEKEQFISKGDIRVRTEQCLKNIQKILKNFGGSLEDVGLPNEWK